MTGKSEPKSQISVQKVIFGVIAFVAIEVLGFFVLGVPDSYALANRGVRVEGTIVKYDWQSNEGVLEYSFGGQVLHYDYSYHVGGNTSYPHEGDKLLLTVDPERPARHSFGDAKQNYYGNLQSFGMMTFIVLILGAFWHVRHSAQDSE